MAPKRSKFSTTKPVGFPATTKAPRSAHRPRGDAPANARKRLSRHAVEMDCRFECVCESEHFIRNALAKVSKGDGEMVAATICTIFAQRRPAGVRTQLASVTDMLTGQFPGVAQLLTQAAADLTAFADFPPAHWRKIWSSNPIERLNKEIKRRTNVVGIFPNPEALLRLTGAVLIETHEEWLAADRRYLSEESMSALAAVSVPVPTLELGAVNAPFEVTEELTSA